MKYQIDIWDILDHLIIDFLTGSNSFVYRWEYFDEEFVYSYSVITDEQADFYAGG